MVTIVFSDLHELEFSSSFLVRCIVQVQLKCFNFRLLDFSLCFHLFTKLHKWLNCLLILLLLILQFTGHLLYLVFLSIDAAVLLPMLCLPNLFSFCIVFLLHLVVWLNKWDGVLLSERSLIQSLLRCCHVGLIIKERGLSCISGISSWRPFRRSLRWAFVRDWFRLWWFISFLIVIRFRYVLFLWNHTLVEGICVSWNITAFRSFVFSTR